MVVRCQFSRSFAVCRSRAIGCSHVVGRLFAVNRSPVVGSSLSVGHSRMSNDCKNRMLLPAVGPLFNWFTVLDCSIFLEFL